MAWIAAIIFVVALVVAYCMAPKPQTAPPPGMGEVKGPTAQEGREIPVLFGTRIVSGPNILWFGDVKAMPIKEEVGK